MTTLKEAAQVAERWDVDCPPAAIRALKEKP